MLKISFLRRLFGKNALGNRLSVVITDEDTRTKQKSEIIIDAETNSESSGSEKNSNAMHNLEEILGKDFKLWCPVHSSGQGYIKCTYDDKIDCYQLSSSGTSKDAQALRLDQKQITEGGFLNFYYEIYLTRGDDSYYLCCDDHETVVASKDPTKRALLQINERHDDLYHSVFKIRGHGNKVLKIGSGDRLFSADFVDAVGFGRFMDPASSFAIVVS